MIEDNEVKIQWKLENSYGTLPSLFFTTAQPEHVPNPELVIFNQELAKELGIDENIATTKHGVDILGGNKIPIGANPLAMAYGGHQFGYFTKLGDGRAILLGEHVTQNGQRIDIQLKGSGQTPYSRGGDGKATLSAMLREYMISEAVYALGIPTTRSLAVVKTGEEIKRQRVESGAILTRTAQSHLRVGTFQYAAQWGTMEDVKSLADYAIDRHYPRIKEDENSYVSLLQKVMDRHVSLVAKWNLVGFIHGVMNTDNVTISGESIDYGPCAFMNEYSPSTVFSSIDTKGRYAYGNQPVMAQWNMARFAETLLPLISPNMDEAIAIAEKIVRAFPQKYHEYWLVGMCKKLGFCEFRADDETLIKNLFEMMEHHKADFTNTFKALTTGELVGIKLFEKKEFKQWHLDWEKRLNQQNATKEEVAKLMKSVNPAVVPRNNLVEKALEDAQVLGNISTMKDFLKVLSHPYEYTSQQEAYSNLGNKPDK